MKFCLKGSEIVPQYFIAIIPFVPKPNVLLIQYIIFVTINSLYY